MDANSSSDNLSVNISSSSADSTLSTGYETDSSTVPETELLNHLKSAPRSSLARKRKVAQNSNGTDCGTRKKKTGGLK